MPSEQEITEHVRTMSGICECPYCVVAKQADTNRRHIRYLEACAWHQQANEKLIIAALAARDTHAALTKSNAAGVSSVELSSKLVDALERHALAVQEMVAADQKLQDASEEWFHY